MSDDSKRSTDEYEDEGDHPVETPFDHPLFLPVILTGLCLYFFYDGCINQDPEMLQHLAFNRGGCGVLFLAATWCGYKGWKEMRGNASTDAPSSDDDRPIG